MKYLIPCLMSVMLLGGCYRAVSSNADTDTDCDTSEEVQQPGTDLHWMRCPMGQTWEVSLCFCSGTGTEMDWNDAMTSCPSGYTLPKRQEFVDLLGGCDSDVLSGSWGYCNSCSKSADCADMFGPDEGLYWSSPSHDGYGAWYAGFSSGSLNIPDKPFKNFVRCVRDGP